MEEIKPLTDQEKTYLESINQTAENIAVNRCSIVTINASPEEMAMAQGIINKLVPESERKARHINIISDED